MAEPLPDLSQYVQIFAQDPKPASANANALWLNTATGALYMYYNDGNSLQWIYVAGGAPPAQPAITHGGRFQWLSSTSCQLIPYRGDGIRIAGVMYSIPSAGITITATGLAASTVYYAYAFISGGAMALEFSTIEHVTDNTQGNVGTEIKSGDNSRTLVGIVQTSSTTTFGPSYIGGNYKLVRSWMNRAGGAMASATLGSNLSLGAGLAQVAPAIFFVCWANESINWTGNFSWFSASATGSLTAVMTLDGSTFGLNNVLNPDASGRVTPAPWTNAGQLTEGGHAAYLQASTTGTCSAYSSCNHMIMIAE
jgi:hypothetical protein